MGLLASEESKKEEHVAKLKEKAEAVKNAQRLELEAIDKEEAAINALKEAKAERAAAEEIAQKSSEKVQSVEHPTNAQAKATHSALEQRVQDLESKQGQLLAYIGREDAPAVDSAKAA